ncbi:polymorphic toxin-type HINT domain-containing protein [Paenibacillus koleovorans]|uniref:polymorphic toxin-type HINT domain-containing protein n=1 Tax=Paenibacillus koleovorans TaxID=121608 RepID=UPI000FD9C90A|nr:polymorphic toxin-type HINT domain-containing protein [Paenibacillus koleovorans]
MIFDKLIKSFKRKIIPLICLFAVLTSLIPINLVNADGPPPKPTTPGYAEVKDEYAGDGYWYFDVWDWELLTTVKSRQVYNGHYEPTATWINYSCHTEYQDVWVNYWEEGAWYWVNYWEEGAWYWVNYWEDGNGNWGGGYYEWVVTSWGGGYYEWVVTASGGGYYESQPYEVCTGGYYEYGQVWVDAWITEYYNDYQWVYTTSSSFLKFTGEFPASGGGSGNPGGGTGSSGSYGEAYTNPNTAPTMPDLHDCAYGNFQFIETGWVYTGYCSEYGPPYLAGPTPPQETSVIEGIWDDIKSLGSLAYHFAKGIVKGIYGSLKGTFEMIRHPVDTLRAVYEMAHSLYKWVTTFDESYVEPLIDALGNQIIDIKNQWTSGSGNDRAELIGKMVGETATSVIGAKGANVVLSELRHFKKIIDLVPCHCFTAGTLVTTDTGEKQIEEIQVGDMVLAKNVDSGAVSYRRVDMLFRKEISESWNIKVGNETITTTDEHPFWVKDKGWVIAKNLTVGDLVETSDGHNIAIDSIEVKPDHATVYNFRVEDFHTYYVSNLKILTHNTSCPNYWSNVVGQRNPTSSSGSNSERLAHALGSVGLSRPDPIPSRGITNWEAHHIVPAGEQYLSAVQARTILGNYGIDVNSPVNGVWLPKNPGVEFTSVEWSSKIATHNGRHIYSYYDYVASELDAVVQQGGAFSTIQSNLQTAIHDIRINLMNGNIVLHNY